MMYSIQVIIITDQIKKMNSSLDCPICLVGYNNTTKFPMIIGKCGHTICRACTPEIKQCPICRQQVKLDNMIKNYALMDKMQSKLEPVKGMPNPPPPSLTRLESVILDQPQVNAPIDCPNGHACLWRGEMFKCAVCSKNQSFGWHCLGCKYLKCDQCAKTQFQNNLCPNSHKTKWEGQISLKDLPYKLPKPYWILQGSSYEHRKACSNQKHYVKKGEPQDYQTVHPIVYSLEEKDKKPKLGGWICTQCIYIRCKLCDPIPYRKEICPNGHKTVWYGQDKECAVCSMMTGGWRCQECRFYQCDKCANKINQKVVQIAHKKQATNCCKLM